QNILAPMVAAGLANVRKPFGFWRFWRRMILAAILKCAGVRRSRMAGFTLNWITGLGFSKSWVRIRWKSSPGEFAIPSPARGHACSIAPVVFHTRSMARTNAWDHYGRLYSMTPEEYKMLRKEIGTQV